MGHNVGTYPGYVQFFKILNGDSKYSLLALKTIGYIIRSFVDTLLQSTIIKENRYF